ncbi:Rho-type gtpase-activating protein [Malassezia brasiliensis]|uniref:Rho-type gtpase-activating protein n=1 Tax=Malassezia brasiliensis TaxID=1821822 RepID=A0AAF0DSS6_9BASI|nr:Rho-type gtpase-activating protein [Malassezia brasiliensis]
MVAGDVQTASAAASRTSSQRSQPDRLMPPASPESRAPSHSRSTSWASSSAATSPVLTRDADGEMICTACNERIDDSDAGNGAVRMSECFWHIECFTCITCGRQVPLDQDNVLLVGTQPMCGECTFNCSVCHQVIVDEVIMCDQDPYHTACFRCSFCRAPIETNVFAKAPGMLACIACQDQLGNATSFRGSEQARAHSLASDSGTTSSATSSSASGDDARTHRRSSLFSAFSSHASPKPSEGGVRDPNRLSVDEPAWQRSSSGTDSSSFELAYDRLSEMIQMEIVQAYYGMQSRAGTPMHALDEHALRSRESLPTLRKQFARRASQTCDSDARHRPASVTDSEIMRSLSLYDSEFEALLATPDFARRASDRSAQRTSAGAVDQLTTEIVEARDPPSPVGADDSLYTSPTVTRARDGPWRCADPDASVLPDEALSPRAQADEAPSPRLPADDTHVPLDDETLQLKRRIALAELLAIDDARAPPGASAHDAPSIRSRVELVLHSLMAHLDAVKQEYTLELQDLVAQQRIVRQELRPMVQLRTALHQDNQRLAARADELRVHVAQLEKRSRQARAHKPLPEDVPGGGRAPPSPGAAAPTTLTVTMTPAEAPRPAPRNAPDHARLDASLPPLPETRKFRWMKPRLLSNQELSMLGESLLQPAFEVKRTPSLLSPTVPPKGAGNDPVHTYGHVFQPTSVLRPSTRCMVCTRNVWGQQEMRCGTCQQVSHTQCLAQVTSMCPGTQSGPPSSPSLHSRTSSSSGISMIGRPLVEQAQREQQLVPRLVDWCVAAVEQNGMNDEGLYRKSGGIQQQRLILQHFDSGQPFDLCDLHQFNDIGAITSVLKHYLRELPEPLIPRDVHDAFLDFGEHRAHAHQTVALDTMRGLLDRLPDVHRATLRRLCLHLKRVDQHANKTRMSARNLGLVFGPTLMRAANPAQELVETSAYS